MIRMDKSSSQKRVKEDNFVGLIHKMFYITGPICSKHCFSRMC